MAKGNTSSAKAVEEKPDEFLLSDGRKVVVKPCYGYHIEEAARITGGEQGKLVAAIAAQLITVDGKKIVFEDIRMWKGKDYMKIMAYSNEWLGFM